MSDHAETIKALRAETSTAAALAADLLDLHDRTGISLDAWSNARDFINETCEYVEVPWTFIPNGA